MRRIVQLAEAGQLPRRFEVDRRALITLGFLSVQHPAPQGRGNAHHGIQLMGGHQLAPLAGQVLLILGVTIVFEALYTPS